MSIKTKITGWYALTLLLLALCLIVSVIRVERQGAKDASKSYLLEAVSEAAEMVDVTDQGAQVDEDLSLRNGGAYIFIYEDTGELVAGQYPASIREESPLHDRAMRRVTDSLGEDWYVYDRQYEFKDEDRTVWIRGMIPSTAGNGSYRKMVKNIQMMIPILILIALLGGYFLTHRALQPVRDVIRTAEQITEDGDLTRRIDPGKGKDEIQHLASSFNSMFDKLEANLAREKQFTSNAAHELRTPISVILSQSEYALEDEEYREAGLAVINREAQNMRSLVGKLLILARGDTGRLEMEREDVDLSMLCEDVAEQQIPLAEDKEVLILYDVEPGIHVNGDETMLIQIMLNLLSNALKYGKVPGGTIRIRLESDGPDAVLSVTDDGKGIEPSKLDRLWNRFDRLDAEETEEYSSGLGLSIVKTLVQAHNGKVWAESTPGEGSSFYVKIPKVKAAN